MIDIIMNIHTYMYGTTVLLVLIFVYCIKPTAM